MAYSTQVKGVFTLSTAVPAEQVETFSQRFRGWRISPNGNILYFPSDADEPDAIGQLEEACKILRESGITVNGAGTWIGEDENGGAIRVSNGIVEYDDSDETGGNA